MKTLGEAGVPAGAVMDTRELAEDDHLNERGTFVTVDHPIRGPIKMPGWPVKMSETNVPTTAAPLLGAHTDEIYSEILGLSPEQIQTLRLAKAI
jgi:formyl-CoA transferase